jgi:hypothetical protein
MSRREVLADLPLGAAVPRDPGEPRTFGPASETTLVISQAEFEVGGSTDSWSIDFSVPGISRHPGATPIDLFAGVHLPTGAVITRVELDGADFSTVGSIGSSLYSATSPQGSFKRLAMMTTGDTAAPGAGLFPYSLEPGVTQADLTIDNAGHYYFIGMTMTPPSVGFSNVRVFYRLEVSPAPATATFGDVPTSHPFFQFVEALVASGITAGCGGGNYCPDAALTRGQMAVFLSKALGLHFAP